MVPDGRLGEPSVPICRVLRGGGEGDCDFDDGLDGVEILGVTWCIDHDQVRYRSVDGERVVFAPTFIDHLLSCSLRCRVIRHRTVLLCARHALDTVAP